jgi:hypothetical protein
MPLRAEVMQQYGQALQTLMAGDTTGGLRLLDGAAMAFATDFIAADPFEVAMILGGAAKTLEHARLYELAALKYADLCAYAEQRLPGTTETAGDYTDLSRMLRVLGDLPGALLALERAARHLQASGAWSQYADQYEATMADLRRKIASGNASTS